MKTRTLIRAAVVLGLLALAVAPLTVKYDPADEVRPAALYVESNEAEAAGTGTATFGDLVVNYYTNGKTEFIIKNPKSAASVLFYAVLTSAQTTTLRGVYVTPGTITLASGGQTAAGNDATDGTVTIPSKPTFGDLTD